MTCQYCQKDNVRVVDHEKARSDGKARVFCHDCGCSWPVEICVFCKRAPATKLCDTHSYIDIVGHPDKSGYVSCDRPMCDECAINAGVNVDICPYCARQLVRGIALKLGRKRVIEMMDEE